MTDKVYCVICCGEIDQDTLFFKVNGHVGHSKCYDKFTFIKKNAPEELDKRPDDMYIEDSKVMALWVGHVNDVLNTCGYNGGACKPDIVNKIYARWNK